MNGCSEGEYVRAKYGGLFSHGEFLKRKIFIPKGITYLQLNSISKCTTFNTPEMRMNYISGLNKNNNIKFDLVNNLTSANAILTIHSSLNEKTTIRLSGNQGTIQYVIQDKPKYNFKNTIDNVVKQGGYIYIDSAFISKFNNGRQENFTFNVQFNKQEFLDWFYSTPFNTETGLPYFPNKKVTVTTFPKEPETNTLVEKIFCIKGSGKYKYYKNIDDYLNDFKFFGSPYVNKKAWSEMTIKDKSGCEGGLINYNPGSIERMEKEEKEAEKKYGKPPRY